MFAPYCPRHVSRILLGYESVVDVEQTPFGPKIMLRCHCGELVAHDSAEPEAVARSLRTDALSETGVPPGRSTVNVARRACLSPGRPR